MTAPDITRPRAPAPDWLKGPTMTAMEEALTDAALLSLFRLRDSLVLRNANLAACEVDSVMDRLEVWARANVKEVA